MTAELALAMNAAKVQPEVSAQPMCSTPLNTRMSDATLRLLQALSSPLEARLLAPSVVREITFLVLSGPQGAALRATTTQDGQFARIAKALRRIHDQYSSELDVATLAGEASMSVPTFHSHFKAVTATSPIQYIKAMRLHQARLMMIRSGLTAASASVKVGYESASQFSREFKRTFGRSPVEEARYLKEVLAVSASVDLMERRRSRAST